MNRAAATVVSAFALLVASVSNAHGQGPLDCPAYPRDLARLDHGLTRSVARLHYGLPLTVVAIGSSSTEGAGATHSVWSYPSRLEAELRHMFPQREIVVHNEGVGGETVHDMIMRLDRSVLGKNPHLVIFQVGTNTILREQSAELAAVKIREAMKLMQDRGIDVILMDAQFAPAVEAKPMAPVMKSILQTVAREFSTSVFPRHALMRHWHVAGGVPVEAFITSDKLHMNDFGYACVARALAASIADAARREVARLNPY